MKIGGFLKNSFIDYKNNISCVVFVTNCNMNCYYCHNKHLLNNNQKELINENEIFDFLQTRKGFIDAVVISGGEPTLQKDLIEFIKKIKSLNYKVKLDTNGTNFEVVKSLIEQNLIDYVAMDIKGPISKYNEIVGNNFKISEVKKTIEFLKQNKIDYEFRTTFCSKLSVNDIEEIAIFLGNVRAYYIQKCNEEDSKQSNEDLLLAQKVAKKHIENVFIRGV